MGRSRGGLTTKIHMVCDANDVPLHFRLSPGQASDISHAQPLLDAARIAGKPALYEITSMRQFARLTLSVPIPEDTTIMNFRHLLEKHQLASGNYRGHYHGRTLTKNVLELGRVDMSTC